MVFAFFVANFGYTKEDFGKLTKKEIAFIYKAWENKHVLETQLMSNAFYNAYVNANRKKGTKPIPLWSKRTKKASVDELRAKFKAIEEIEKKDKDKKWVNLILKNYK